MESLKEYYLNGQYELPADMIEWTDNQSHFNILKRKNCFRTLNFSRRDYYKMVLLKGTAVLMTEKGDVTIDQPALFLSVRHVRYGWRNMSEGQEGFSCLFNETFIQPRVRDAFRKLIALFPDPTAPYLFLDEKEYQLLFQYFELLNREYAADFNFRDQMINDWLHLVLWSVIRIQSHRLGIQTSQFHSEFVVRFQQLLGQQFPVDGPSSSPKLKKPADYAEQLNVHVNYLNYLLKKELGKTTTELIQERMLVEAVDLLLYSNWRITEIAQALGFEYPQHFHAFFKRMSGQSPREFRSQFSPNS